MAPLLCYCHFARLLGLVMNNKSLGSQHLPYPSHLLQFEAGISSRQETLSSEPKYGVITHTLVTSADPTHSDEPAKKMKKIDLPNTGEGYAYHFLTGCTCNI